MTPKGYTEDELVEQPAIELLDEMGWVPRNCFNEFTTGKSFLGRENKGEVVLLERLRPALTALNPDLPPDAINQAIEELTRDRSAMSLAEANREIYDLVKRGVPVTFHDPKSDGHTEDDVQVIDWKQPGKNDFFLASQFWVTGEMYTRRADLVGFVNGLPLLFIELKASHRRLKKAYDDNLCDYRDAIPHLLWYNAFIILSNGSESRVGSVTAGWEHFAEWKRVTNEEEPPAVSLETVLRGTCTHERFLDLMENFTLFQEAAGGTIKLVAKNHQYLGVNNAIDALQSLNQNRGKLGVFWHTQGSGKSVSMIFYAQKAHRKLAGNWTFVIVTDRQELDDQIYREFAKSGVITEAKPQATSSKHLCRLLTEDHRYVFTLIHKFRTDKGKVHPILSERDNIIVIADEAHRTQYDTLALNMRNALPAAAFIAFTGTPLISGEEKTRDVFGDYVSVYNFKQSTDDDATVPLFYENRIPELQLTNDNLTDDIYRVVEEAELDEEQEKKFERSLSREYHLITRDDRLDKVAADIVMHFMSRGFLGKAMVVCIDKATAIRMHDKVKHHWQAYQDNLAAQLDTVTPEQRPLLEHQLTFMQGTDMAVVVSPSQGEVAEMRKKGLDIKAHRKRIVNEDLDEKFKDPAGPFRIVFVCAMWMTGFDVPSCSTIYLDKPMRRHTLMQTIARANRVFPEKENGVIVDYVGVFRDLQRALAIYGSESGGGVKPGEWPVQDKAALRERLKQAINKAQTFCIANLVDLDAITQNYGLDRLRLLDDAREALLINDDTKQQFLTLAGSVAKLYKAILPDTEANQHAPICTALAVLIKKIRSLTPPADVSHVMHAVEEVLDRSIAAEGYVIHEGDERTIDLSKLDIKALQQAFTHGRKRTQAETLRNSIHARLHRLVQLNKSRTDYLDKFKQLIDTYNAGAINVEVFFERLIRFARELTQEEQRSVAEELTEEELAIFDLLTKPDTNLNNTQTKEVKKVARDLLTNLKKQKLVLDWRKRQQTRATVRLAIEQTLDHLPRTYTPTLYQQKCELIYQHIYESYYGPNNNIYAETA